MPTPEEIRASWQPGEVAWSGAILVQKWMPTQLGDESEPVWLAVVAAPAEAP